MYNVHICNFYCTVELMNICLSVDPPNDFNTFCNIRRITILYFNYVIALSNLQQGSVLIRSPDCRHCFIKKIQLKQINKISIDFSTFVRKLFCIKIFRAKVKVLTCSVFTLNLFHNITHSFNKVPVVNFNS